MFPVRYERGFYIPEDGISRSRCRENLKSYIMLISLLSTVVLFGSTHRTNDLNDIRARNIKAVAILCSPELMTLLKSIEDVCKSCLHWQ
jgi:hypothetical protein